VSAEQPRHFFMILYQAYNKIARTDIFKFTRKPNRIFPAMDDYTFMIHQQVFNKRFTIITPFPCFA
jgi:hypothetical protein